MEHFSRSVSRIKKRECFLTQTPKEDIRVHFKQSGNFTPQHYAQTCEIVPISNFKRTSNSQVKSVEGRTNHKALSISRLKIILRESKEASSRKIVKNEGKNQLVKSQSTQQISKYYRISINDDELKQSVEGSQQCNGNISTRLVIKPSINMFLQCSQTETPQEESSLRETTKNINRLQRRRKCRIATQKQFVEECSKYIQSKEREETNELFRQLNREMKLHQKRKEPNNYYQKIRRSALKKIDYMSFNQKYYDDQEVKHLYSVVDNCNILIHKRGNQSQQQYNRVTTDRNLHFEHKEHKEHKEPEDQHNRTSISTKEFCQSQNPKITRFLTQPVQCKPAVSKRSRLSKKEKSDMNKKISDIVDVCENERKMLEEVKNGMKVFEFYCSKLDYGFAVKGKRLNNFLLGEEEN